ncbi:MAG: hypothetical protein RDU89_00555 [bacterium]|nr:hypothetical protein [bacterium]
MNAMGAYMQMGHHTENLVGERGLEEFVGIVLSPINREYGSLQGDVQVFRNKGIADIVLDPQLYFPRTERERIRALPYFPDNYDSANSHNLGWWKRINTKLAQCAKDLGVNTVASPAVVPRAWSDGYYAVSVETANLRGLKKIYSSSR